MHWTTRMGHWTPELDHWTTGMDHWTTGMDNWIHTDCLKKASFRSQTYLFTQLLKNAPYTAKAKFLF